MILVSRISYKIIKETGGIENFVKAEGLSGPDQAREVIFAAGLLHDMGRWRQYDTGEDHALAGSRMARAVLERAGFTPDEIRIVARAIGEHRRAGPGTSYLGRVISRADDLSRPCGTCEARAECYKYDYMESLKEKKRKLGVRG
ncbi:MAG: HD domain-containing protein [Peptococcaceae bacterium]|nr:HD domain-containing protein [Peptococcaceae bacterium]